jgi:PKD repeat protein
MNSVNLVTSVNEGSSYTHPPAPSHLVAAAPYRYAAGSGPLGVFDPSNIVHRPDGYYYATVRVEPYGAQDHGICLMRTATLGDPTSWRAWDGTGYGVRFINPYLEPNQPPQNHVCRVLSPGLLPYGNSSITYSTYLQKYVFLAVSEKANPTTGESVSGFYYSLSDDLIHWTEQRLLMEGVLMWRHRCGDADPVLYPSLIDPASPDRNFGTIGRHPYLYFTRFNYQYWGNDKCWMTLDRDLLRIPVEFTVGAGPPANQPPTASFTILPNPALPGQAVTFDGSASSDPDGRITSYRWDLDGDGTFETDGAASATITSSYPEASAPTVGLQVTDDKGAVAYSSRLLMVGSPALPPPSPAATASGGPFVPVASNLPAASAPSPPRSCAVLAQRRARLRSSLRKTRHRLARTRGKGARRRLRVRIRTLERRLARLRKEPCRR